ncbi:TetR family transcriptional regulator [Streptomyces sp. TLI_55]|uniref:TetR/AcrR family transcriptional regulator n=1 Tax=Streptomyces sp. TLI_55 TaxID=1938861 RepID=UPI000BD7CA73|nr:TetR/AcrR family transcriptional regulator [Streptomyces sp. TLI_55]SNX88366.1 TetR family transcriptional regulator [Streptomyces sp. TLI_55]
MRSDAQSNRMRILEAAAEVLSAPGGASLKSIARRAGVGQGTLYRHFPTRESLVLEVYGEEVDQLVAAVPDLLGALSPQRALCAWLRRLLYVGRCMPEFADAMSEACESATERCRRAYRPLSDALSALVAANAAAGTIAPGTTAEDVLVLLGPLWRVGVNCAEESRAERLFEVLMRGLCPEAPPKEQGRGRDQQKSSAG